ncbi:MAG: DUF192 domain-containing protein [Candidatus Kerfeldbacteria bacterium]|nr:DUF192 domain-containing protein [Candidatus Kerfeldbacteria bacterium]
MGKLPWLLLGAAVVFFGAVWLWIRPDTLAGATLAVGDAVFSVEIADEPLEQYQGLRDRDTLARDHGMLFVFEDARERVFTMDGVPIPLDLIWIRDSRVIGITANVPPAASGAGTRYGSPEPADTVLEVLGGVAAAAGIAEGTSVEVKY